MHTPEDYKAATLEYLERLRQQELLECAEVINAKKPGRPKGSKSGDAPMYKSDGTPDGRMGLHPSIRVLAIGGIPVDESAAKELLALSDGELAKLKLSKASLAKQTTSD